MAHDQPLFQKVGNKIYFDGQDLTLLVSEKVKTPVYLFSERELHRNIDRLQNAFRKNYPNVSIAYSMKNNSLPEIVSIIAQRLESFEINSLKELQILEMLAKKNGSKFHPITTTLYKPPEFIAKMISSEFFSEPLFAIDSFQDFRIVKKVAEQFKKRVNVLVRVNPGLETSSRDAVFASAGLNSKCGLPIGTIASLMEMNKTSLTNTILTEPPVEQTKETAEYIIQEISKSNWLNLQGLHFHTGSQITDLDYFNNVYEIAALFYKWVKNEFATELTILDLGGGYPVQYLPVDKVPSLDAIANCLSTHLKKHAIAPEVILESGRYITASAGILLTTVKLIKQLLTGQRLAVLDFSVYSDLLDTLTAKWFYQPILVNNLPQETQTNSGICYELVGCTNDVLDRLPSYLDTSSSSFSENINGHCFPRELKEGDLIAIKNAGAYTTCFNSEYSGKPISAKFVLKK
ncbi:MAG: diaminopimelate decarboxylase family protein [Candidatus Heimdallarchaeota archaeon]